MGLCQEVLPQLSVAPSQEDLRRAFYKLLNLEYLQAYLYPAVPLLVAHVLGAHVLGALVAITISHVAQN